MDLALAPSDVVLTAARQWFVPVQQRLGDALVSACVTGSALQPDFDARHRHINVLVVTQTLPVERLDALAAALPHRLRGPHVDPLFVTLEQLERSLDTFPIEWLDVRERHHTIAGRELFGTLEVPLKGLRLQIERELRGKHLRLTQTYLLHMERPAELHAALAASASGFRTLFRALVRLNGESPAPTHDALVSRIAALHGVSASGLSGPHRMRELPRHPGADESRAVYRAFLAELERLVRAVDGFPIP